MTKPPLRIATALGQIVPAFLVAGAIWWGCLHILPPLRGLDLLPNRLLFALKCSAAAILLTFLTATEAVSHARLVSPAFDPLAGKESRPLLVDLRYLQNTLEQVILFVPGLLLMAAYAEDGAGMRAVVAASLVWVISRITFWVGYQLGPQYRIAGLVGHVQTMLVLLYVCARFGHEMGGAKGAAVPLLLFAGAEAFLVIRVLKR